MQGNFVVHRYFRRLNFFWGNLWHGKVNLNISELSAENGVAVVNASGSIIGDNEDHVNDSTTEVC